MIYDFHLLFLFFLSFHSVAVMTERILNMTRHFAANRKDKGSSRSFQVRHSLHLSIYTLPQIYLKSIYTSIKSIYHPSSIIYHLSPIHLYTYTPIHQYTYQILVARRRKTMQYLKRVDFRTFTKTINALNLQKEAGQLSK